MAAALAGCGGTPAGTTKATSAGTPAAAPGPNAGSFAWLQPRAAPAGWPTIRIANGATLPYPPGWRRIKSDPGTGSAALLGSHDRFLGYLNITPQQGAETLGNWSRFRVEHNGEEGDRAVTRRASADGLRFRTGRGACVRDSYTTQSDQHFIELACLIAGRRAATVVVGAAPPGSWNRTGPLLERAISAVTT